MTSVMGLLEERETAARVRAEELRAESERILAELAEAEEVLERRVIARAELAEALAAPVADVEDPADKPPAAAPVAGSVVPPWHDGVSTDVLAVDYRRVVELVADEPADGEGVSAKELALRLGLETVPAKVEGVRSKAKRLAERGWLQALVTGWFTPRPPTSTAPSAVPRPGGRDGGS
uniref:Uncharacterized protein n=1 Tax=Streptomyces sp. NBC_00003 TaxID=2903608 RepID=A0AAU2UVV3_9ACTN